MKIRLSQLKKIIREEVEAIGSSSGSVRHVKVLGSRDEMERFKLALTPKWPGEPLLVLRGYDDPGLKYYTRRDRWRVSIDVPSTAIKDHAAFKELMSQYPDAPRTG